MQTAIVITLIDGTQVLVTIQGINVPEGAIHTAEREHSWESWSRPLPVEVRHEGE